MIATCDACAASVAVAPGALFDLAPACAACGGAMVLDPGDEDAPAAPPLEPATQADRDPLPPAATRAFHDLPTKADTEDDPYALAALALDQSVVPRSGGWTRAFDADAASRRTTEQVPTWSEAELDREFGATPGGAGGVAAAGGAVEADDAPSGSVILLPGGVPAVAAPPLPSFEDTQQVRAAALAATAPAADAGPAAEVARPAGDGDVVVVVPAGGTSGRGSRTFERGDLLPRPAAPADLVPERGTTARVARLATGTHAPGDRLFGDDLDWLALIDDQLPEDGEAASGGSPRVVIRVPDAAAALEGADSQTVRRLQRAVEDLEAGRGANLGALLGGAGGDARKARRLGEGAPGGEDVEARAGEATRAMPAPLDRPPGGARPQDPGQATQTLAPGEAEAAARGAAGRPEDDTRSWAEAEGAAAARGAGTDRLPAQQGQGSSRMPVAQRPRKVERFHQGDLDPGLVCARDVGSPEADVFRHVYHRLFAERDGATPRAVLVTSPGRGEGRTTVAANLAIVGARLPGRGAVLVDADPRGRGVLRAFGLNAREGLLEALAGHGDPARAVMQFNLGTLDVVPLGIPGSDAPELLTSEAMGRFMARLRELYPLASIVVDGSAVLGAADPVVLARHVDGVLVVARAGRTRREDLRRAVDALGPRRVLGVVLNEAAA